MRISDTFLRLFITAALVSSSGCGSVSAKSEQLTQVSTMSFQLAQKFAIEDSRSIADVGESNTIELAKKAVAEKMKDPDSVKFKDVRFVQFDGGLVICGEVNARNSYGGYAGFSRFISGTSSAMLIDNDSRNRELAAAKNHGIYMACGL